MHTCGACIFSCIIICSYTRLLTFYEKLCIWYDPLGSYNQKQVEIFKYNMITAVYKSPFITKAQWYHTSCPKKYCSTWAIHCKLAVGFNEVSQPCAFVIKGEI